MRVSPRELKAVQLGGLTTRYAVLGDAVFVIVEVPEGGSAGTALEEPCREAHWGMILRGEVELESRRPRVFGPGTAFHVAPGPLHRFRTGGRAVIAGFQPISAPPDETPDGLRAKGVEILPDLVAPDLPPVTMTVVGTRARAAVTGHVRTVSALMGAWMMTRSTFGPKSGFADGWCDLPHWGLVLDGDLVLHWENREIELLGPGDVFHCPADGTGHRIEVADRATIVDYTPIAAIDDPDRRRAPRAVAALAASTVRTGAGARGAPSQDEDRAGVG